MVHPLSHAGGEWSEQPDFLARKLAAVNWLPFRIDLKIQWNYFRGRKTIIIKKSRDKSEAYDPLKVGPCHPQESKENLVTHSPRRVMFWEELSFHNGKWTHFTSQSQESYNFKNVQESTNCCCCFSSFRKKRKLHQSGRRILIESPG